MNPSIHQSFIYSGNSTNTWKLFTYTHEKKSHEINFSAMIVTNHRTEIAGDIFIHFNFKFIIHKFPHKILLIGKICVLNLSQKCGN